MVCRLAKAESSKLQLTSIDALMFFVDVCESLYAERLAVTK